ncbi:MAG: ATP-dependent protease [Tolumonas sp.]|nr:MAG: ATP-dependent protease [Tolumonas sp.]
MQLAIFPLRLNLLPDGVLPLRIFEPRYMRMIAESSRRGMGLCLLGKSLDGGYSPLLTVGTRVEIIDFDLLADNTLSVTLKGVERFKIHAMEVEPDGLLSAEVQLLPGWHHEPLQPEQHILAEKLGLLFDEHPSYAAYYPTPQWTDVCWVVQRWLEVLPLEAEEKFSLMASNDYHEALHFLLQAVQEEEAAVRQH